MSRHAVLSDANKVVPVDFQTWAEWFETARDRRFLRKDTVNGKTVSTVFVGINLSFNDEHPLWFETMIFGLEHEYQRRYATYAGAIEGHKKAVEIAKRAA